MGKRGQGAFEYILLLAGVLLIVVLAIIILQGTIRTSGSGTSQNNCKAQLAASSVCYGTNGLWDPLACQNNASASCNFVDYGINANCGTALSGTPWAVTSDATAFACGPKPA